MTNPILVDVTRGDLVESTHRGAIAIVDAEGGLVFALGDVESAVFTRSSLKPIQALPLVESGAAEAFGVTDDEVALACASHSGEVIHTGAVEEWLDRIGCSERDLACGPQLPRHEPTLRALLANQEKPSRLHNNCSGKHAGFLTLAKHLRAPIEGYVAMSHPVQQAVLATLARLSGVTNPASGIDGCAAPNFAIPLTAFARALAQIAGKKTPGAARILRAMMSYPELVAGSGRFCTAVMRAAKDKAAVKVGAEGVYAAMLPELGFGVAIKIDDGAIRGAEVALAVVLEKLDVLSSEAGLTRHTIRNTVDAPVGEVRPAAGLRTLEI